ncbi:MAG: DUF898 family protein, partial [Treponema sp.]|nr:DUF898 family protein [Treponema sp.]
MKCSKCGNPLEPGAVFCPSCGEKVEAQQSAGDANAAGTSYSSAASDQNTQGGASNGSVKKEKIDIKSYLTPENIERFGPAASVIPLAMGVVVFIFGTILGSVLSHIPVVSVVFGLLVFLLKAVFVLVPAAATAYLVKIALGRNTSSVNTWIAPAATALAPVSCICKAAGADTAAFIIGIIPVVVGLELIARITIKGEPMDSAFDPAGAVNTYKKYIADYRAAHPTTKELEKAGIEDPEHSKFDGSGAELFGLVLLTGIVSGITCGIAAPWMICKVYKWRIDHTVINNRRLKFTGTGGDLLGKWILWEILTIITCGIYGFFVHVALRKWELQHTLVEDDPLGVPSDYDGTTGEYVGYSIFSGIMCTLT